MKSTKFAVAAVLAAGLGLSTTANALDGAKLFASPTKGGCSACHGKDAKTPLMPMYPKIAGQNAAYIVQQMKDIKSGARNNGMSVAMKGIMHMVNDAEIEAIAKYLSGLK